MTGLQLTALLRRLGPWQGGGTAAVWPQSRGSAGSAAASASNGAVDGAAEIRRRTLAATGSVAAAEETTQVWTTLAADAQAAVLDPAGTMTSAARQTDATTCGSAVLTMLAATGDPSLALWLVTGRLGPVRPPELVGAPPGALALLATAPAERRFAAVQRVLKRRSTATALFGLPWPAALGTPPWGAARVARFPGVTFHHQPVDDTDQVHLRGVLDAVEQALAAGVPVPLYSGGDSSRGWATATPRHVVLAVGRRPGGLRVFEPGQGRLHTVSRRALAVGGTPQPGLGGWPHLAWVLLPFPTT